MLLRLRGGVQIVLKTATQDGLSDQVTSQVAASPAVAVLARLVLM